MPFCLVKGFWSGAEKSSMRKNIARTAARILAGITALLFVAGFAARGMVHPAHHGPRASGSTRPENPAVVVAPSTPAPSKPAAVAQPAPAKPKVVAATVPIAVPAAGAGTWRVVAFTYNHQDQADHKAYTINDKHPDLQASVFSPK